MQVDQCGCPASDIFQQKKWKELQEAAEARGLVRLSESAKNMAMETHTESTVKGYKTAFNQWRTWANENEFSALPATEIAVTMYLVDLLGRVDTASPVKAVAAIAWAHKKACVPPPTGDMTEQAVTAAKRRLAH